MVDELPLYDNLTLAQTMSSQSHEIKFKYNYSIVLEACANTGASYVLTLEDDVLFLDGWWSRVGRALDLAAIKTWEAGYIDFLYLRLFYYEGLLGWNQESWPVYLSLSLAVATAILSVLLITPRYLVASRWYITRFSLGFVALVATPLFIVLYFDSGGNCVSPRPAAMGGLECLQSFIEAYADVTQGLRWALIHVVMQHICGQCGHGSVGTGDLVTPKEIWNFGFEENNPEFLADERLQVDDN
ncbi:hypothetical protein FHL15_004191 [Xylaria flabelliformis]|uniref:Uncharacterized protein n=1 Tax=Xylaria flabelliformis TaxID=2512241 RepID=A0A553I4G8_9PEZI|nr:hypothetical protein FHL15_004191 [Xylaria flabelliformis]